MAATDQLEPEGSVKAYYDYAKDCGCGSARCNGGWYYWHGTEYPCGYQAKQKEKAEQEAEQEKGEE